MSSGVAVIGLEGVNLFFLRASPKFMTTFSMLPAPIPYSESESLSLLRRFRFLVSRFLRAFSSLSNFSLNCVKDCFVGLVFFPPFLAAQKSAFSVPSLSKRCQSRVLCVVYVPLCFLHRSQCFLVRTFFWDSGTLSTRSLRTLLLAVRGFLVARRVGFVGSFLPTYALDSLERLKERTHIGRSTTFLVKVVLILPRVGTHLENVTR